MLHDRAAHLHPAPDERTHVHRASRSGIGRDRTAETGSGFAALYPSPIREELENPDRTDERLLLFFHRVSWNHRLSSGLTVRESLQASYNHGVTELARLVRDWDALRAKIDPSMHADVATVLRRQLEHAERWRVAMLEYFTRFWSENRTPGVEVHDNA
jgi:alpha-glucuronidase